MTNSKYIAHTDPLFRSLKLPKLRISLTYSAWNSGTNLWTIMYQPILLPCSETIMNCMKFKLEAMNVYIYIRFVHPMPTVPWDIEFQSCYVNFQLRSQKKHVLTALCRLLTTSNFTSSVLIVPNVWSHNVTYVQGQGRNIIHLYQQRHLPSWN